MCGGGEWSLEQATWRRSCLNSGYDEIRMQCGKSCDVHKEQKVVQFDLSEGHGKETNKK